MTTPPSSLKAPSTLPFAGADVASSQFVVWCDCVTLYGCGPPIALASRGSVTQSF